MSVNISPESFHRRLSILQKNLLTNTDVSSLLLVVGASDDENTYKKTTVTQTWLTGYELASTGIFITENKCVIITGEKSSKHFKPLTAKPTANSSDVEIWARSKADQAANKKIFDDLIEQLKAAPAVGHVAKDEYRGKFIDEWTAASKDAAIAFVDCSGLLSTAMAAKDKSEISLVKKAAKSSTVMMDNFANEMMTIVDEELKITNLALSDKIEAKIDNDKWFNKTTMGKKLLVSGEPSFDSELLDWCYSPIIQSGGEYDIKPSAQSTKKPLVGDGVILASLGLRYKSYCSNIGRTFLIDPTKEMESNYEFLLKLQEHIVQKLLNTNTTGKQVYEGALEFINKEKPELSKYFPKNCGWLLGIEFRDSNFVLNVKNEKKLANGMIIALTIGFQGIEEDGKKYSLILSDTYEVTENGGEATLLTNYSKARSEVSFFFKEDDSNTAAAGSGSTGQQGDDKVSKLKSEKNIKIEKILKLTKPIQKFLRVSYVMKVVHQMII